MFVLQTMRHSPESCPLGNPKNLDTMTRWLENLEATTAEHGIKVIGVWFDRAGHTSYAVFDAPSMEAFTAFEVSPQNIPVVTLHTTEKKVVTSLSETLTFFRTFSADS